MTKWYILTLLILFLFPLVNGLEMCRDTKEINTNCTMLTPTVTNCSTFNYSIYEANTSLLVEEGDLSFFASDIYQFNFTLGQGDYIVQLCDKSTREVKVTDEEEGKMVLAILILLPMILGAFFLISIFMFGQGHNYLKLFLFGVAILSFIASAHAGLTTLVRYYNFPELQDFYGTTIYWVTLVCITILGYFMLYFIYLAFEDVKMKKQKQMEL